MLTHNNTLFQQSNFLRGRLIGGVSLRLFINDFIPSPADNIAAFHEAGFSGYARVGLTGLLSPVFKVLDGLYEFDMSEADFACNGPTHQTVFGFFIADAGDVLFSQRLSNAVFFDITQWLKVTIQFQVGTF
jgi:hypothetical protein